MNDLHPFTSWLFIVGLFPFVQFSRPQPYRRLPSNNNKIAVLIHSMLHVRNGPFSSNEELLSFFITHLNIPILDSGIISNPTPGHPTEAFIAVSPEAREKILSAPVIVCSITFRHLLFIYSGISARQSTAISAFFSILFRICILQTSDKARRWHPSWRLYYRWSCFSNGYTSSDG